jgi:hypothetical protein
LEISIKVDKGKGDGLGKMDKKSLYWIVINNAKVDKGGGWLAKTSIHQVDNLPFFWNPSCSRLALECYLLH